MKFEHSSTERKRNRDEDTDYQGPKEKNVEKFYLPLEKSCIWGSEKL